MIKYVNKNLEAIPEIQHDSDMTIEAAIEKSSAVPIWETTDGDDNTLLLSVHSGGFLIAIKGDNYVDSATEIEAFTETWFDFTMLNEISEVMEKYKYLISEDD